MNLREEAHSLNEKDFRFICSLVYEATGIVLGEHKREMVYRRLMRRIRETQVPTFKIYCELLRDSSSNELPNFINSITTNLTSFFREKHHFDFLEKKLIPEILKKPAEHKSYMQPDRQRIRIWSSACSTGEEPYSIAMTTLDALGPRITGWDVKILATDLDTDVLNRARSGIYQIDDAHLKNIPAEKKKWFLKKNHDHNHLKVRDEVTQLIRFNQLNLLHQWPMKGPFDMIFCRNVMIYFDRKTQQDIIRRMHSLLTSDGVLALGHSENIGECSKLFENIGRTLFRKTAHSTAFSKSGTDAAWA